MYGGITGGSGEGLVKPLAIEWRGSALT